MSKEPLAKPQLGTCKGLSRTKPHRRTTECIDWQPLAKPDESVRACENCGKPAWSYTRCKECFDKEYVPETRHIDAESIKREAVRETVERCYKLSCHYCAENAEATFLFGAWRHLTKETSRGIPCAASAIRSAFEKGE